MIKKIYALCAILMLMTLPMSARQNVLDIKHALTDSTIIYPESFETDSRKLLENWYVQNYTTLDDSYSKKSDVEVSDEVIIERLQAMPTIIEMPFNDVIKSYIKRYTKHGRAQVAGMLGLSHYYMPIFEQALEAQGLPLELKYLPVIESALDPNAVSSAGAAGLWQFVLVAARGVGLEVNSLIDERRDPYLSSEKAAALLKDLYEIYGDWHLAIAAYNCGPGNVNKAIRRVSGQDDSATYDFWSIYGHLPKETRGYVPAFIAANYVMTYHTEHNIAPVLATKPLVTDTIMVSERVHLQQISDVLDIPIDELRLLNPHFRADIIPGTPSRQCTLILPSQQIHAYIVSEEQILNRNKEKYARREVVEPGVDASESFAYDENGNLMLPQEQQQALTEKEKEVQEDMEFINQKVAEKRGEAQTIIHKVKAGESLATIASLYDVDPADIKRDNNLRRNAVRVGQQLRVTTTKQVEGATVAKTNQAPAQKVEKKTTTEKTEKKTASTKNEKSSKKESSKKKKSSKKSSNKTHKVKSGESLSTIAAKHGVTVNELKKANNLKGNTIHPGDKLKVPSKKKSKSKSKKRKR